MDARVFLLLMTARMVGDYLYSWGGEEADEGGFDCSGFASIALMQAARAWPKLYTGVREFETRSSQMLETIIRTRQYTDYQQRVMCEADLQ